MRPILNLIKKITIPKDLCYNIFFLENEELSYIGYRQKLSDESRYSILQEGMLLGKFLKMDVEADSYVIYFIKGDVPYWGKKLSLSCENWDIRFPFAPRDATGAEALCDAQFWQEKAKNAEDLDKEEAHFRGYSIKMLSELPEKPSCIYDPACSTGKFLSTMQEYYPENKYWASDASEEMVKCARSRGLNSFVLDIIKDQPPRSFDIIFCRFVNQEIVQAAKAETVIKKLYSFLEKDGYLIIFGHTPVACNIVDFCKKEKLVLRHRIGWSEAFEGIFQYYILQKN